MVLYGTVHALQDKYFQKSLSVVTEQQVTRKICVLFLFAASYDAAFFFEPLWYFIETQKDVPSNKVSE
jgi:hypothetical protein